MKIEIHIQYAEGEQPGDERERVRDMLDGPKWKSVVKQLHENIGRTLDPEGRGWARLLEMFVENEGLYF